MTLTQATTLVRERWGRLGLSPEEFPRVFSSDVDNMLEEAASTGNILDFAGDSDRRLDGIAGQRNEREIPVSGETRSLLHLDVAPQQDQPTKAVNHESGTGEVGLKTGDGCARKPLTNTNSDTQLIRHNSNPYRGVAVSPAAPQVLDVADQATGNAPVIDSPMVGIGGEAPAIASPLHQGLLIERLTRSVERAEEHAEQLEVDRLEELAAAEEGAAIEASNLPDPQFESNGRY